MVVVFSCDASRLRLRGGGHRQEDTDTGRPENAHRQEDTHAHTGGEHRDRGRDRDRDREHTESRPLPVHAGDCLEPQGVSEQLRWAHVPEHTDTRRGRESGQGHRVTDCHHDVQ